MFSAEKKRKDSGPHKDAHEFGGTSGRLGQYAFLHHITLNSHLHVHALTLVHHYTLESRRQ